MCAEKAGVIVDQSLFTDIDYAPVLVAEEDCVLAVPRWSIPRSCVHHDLCLGTRLKFKMSLLDLAPSCIISGHQVEAVNTYNYIISADLS